MIFENDSTETDAESDAAYRERIEHEWDGIEKLPGTYPFTLDRSVKAYRLNSFLHSLLQPERRKRFLDEPGAAVRRGAAQRGGTRHAARAATGAR